MILNQSYEPITICSAKKAVLLMYMTKAELVAKRDGQKVHSIHHSIPYPSVIRLSRFIHIPYKRIELSRKNIIRRDNFHCQYCGAKSSELTIDHIIPKSRGGADNWDNLVSACKKCNNKKGSRTPEEASMKLLHKPSKPNHIVFFRQYMGKNEEPWKPFLFM